MGESVDIKYPKLRPVDARHIVHDGRPCLLLRDPLQLTDKVVLIPQPLASVLSLCDGTREDARALSLAFALRTGLGIDPAAIEYLLNALNEALMLDNDRFAKFSQEALANYRQAPFRPPMLAGQVYPQEAEALRELLDGYLSSVKLSQEPEPVKWRGLISPHIDYPRGGPVYAHVWGRAAEAVREAELAIIFGTNHYGAGELFALTRQNYATPYGVLPTSREIVDLLADAIGHEAAFAGELCHRGEHSIELAAVWLHHMRGGEPCHIVPILCGSFARFVLGEADLETDPSAGKLLEALRGLISGRKTIVVAAADLSHVGPAFGGEPLDLALSAKLRQADGELMDRICQGDARGFFEAIRNVRDENNVCGVSPIYFALKLLEPVCGESVAYDRCPADQDGTSVVSICGVVFK